ncbi:lachrymatory-factor synthase-like [Triticum urartu]|uniref:Lachrymatory-factor synthase n=1 Tax=Triticum urartu TaxID=4572 RepID=A0A8R7PQJ0_TRIUA|nr:lachrymatory-factor synthase-like [Triticum urartu]
MDVPTAGGAAAAAPQRRAWEWEGRVVSPVPAATADEAWALLSDFLAFHKWHPRVAVCRLASASPSGAAAAPGCVRYCEGTPPGDGAPADWAHETLLEHDQARRFFRYEMNDNNMGFGAFFAAFRVVPAAHAGGGCELRWEFECEPVRGTPKEALEARLQAGLDGMAARVHEHLMSARAAVAAAAPAPAVAAGLEAADELKLDNSIAA